METRHLACFLAVVDTGGFTKAAEALHVSQPALSQTIKSLEDELGVLLFDRIGRRALISDAGLRLVELARQVMRGMDEVRLLPASMRAGLVGDVHIASSPSPAVAPMPSIIDELHRKYPDVTVRIYPTFTAGDGLEAVRSARCELALVANDSGIVSPGLTSTLVEELEFVVIAPPGTPRTGGPLTREQLSGWRFVIGQPGTRMRELFDQLVDRGIDVRAVVEAGHREGVLPLVVKGVGAAIMPEPWSVIAGFAGATVFRLDPPDLYKLWLVRRAGRLTPAAHAFVDAVDTYRGRRREVSASWAARDASADRYRLPI